MRSGSEAKSQEFKDIYLGYLIMAKKFITKKKNETHRPLKTFEPCQAQQPDFLYNRLHSRNASALAENVSATFANAAHINRCILLSSFD